MDKIETPEEFVSRVNLHDRGWHGMSYQDEVAAVAARDALIRADERQKAADRFREAYCQKCEQYGLHDRVNDPCPELARLRAAIMAKPEEGMK